MVDDKKKQDFYVFRCMECNCREVIPNITGDAENDIHDYLEKSLISSGCHIGCGTMKWGVYDRNGYSIGI